MRSVALPALILLTLAAGCRVESPAPLGDVAPPFDLERIDGGRVTLGDLSGKTVLVDFWVTWCPPCVLEIPELNAFYRAHRENGVEVLAISVDASGRDELDDWARERDVQYPIAIGGEEVARLYGARAFPFHVLISPEGRILERLTPGYHDREELAALLERHQR